MGSGQIQYGLRAPLEIHFGAQANLFDSGRRQKKAILVLANPKLTSLTEVKNLLPATKKQLLERLLRERGV